MKKFRQIMVSALALALMTTQFAACSGGTARDDRDDSDSRSRTQRTERETQQQRETQRETQRESQHQETAAPDDIDEEELKDDYANWVESTDWTPQPDFITASLATDEDLADPDYAPVYVDEGAESPVTICFRSSENLGSVTLCSCSTMPDAASYLLMSDLVNLTDSFNASADENFYAVMELSENTPDKAFYIEDANGSWHLIFIKYNPDTENVELYESFALG